MTDAGGAPVEWASVFFVSGDHPTPDIAALTDAAGAFALTAPAPGAYRVGCLADDHDLVEVDVAVADTDVDLAITLPAGPPAAE